MSVPRTARFSIAALALTSCARSGFQPQLSDVPSSRSVMPADWQFWWGISSSAYQSEDPGPPDECRDFKTDWDLFYDAGELKQPRANGTWSYSLVERDIEALRRLGVTHYRFGVEWARIEPRPGEYNDAALAHYAGLARSLREAGIEPVVALWHFTFPSWLSDMRSVHRHGWFHADAVPRWEAYVRRVVEALAPHVQTFAPQNEPNAYALAVYLGLFPPGRTASYDWYLRCMEREADSFRIAARIIRRARSDARVISIQNIIHWEKDAFDLGSFWYRKGLEYNFYHLDLVSADCDWIGFNYYASEVASPLALLCQRLRRGPGVSDMGWRINPGGLEAEIAVLAARYGKPLVITENGIADRTDRKRQRYLMEHALAVRRAVRAGHDVRGYFHWSLIDNFEWFEGYDQGFGLCRLDGRTRDIIPKESALLYRALVSSELLAPEAGSTSTQGETSRARHVIYGREGRHPSKCWNQTRIGG